MTETRQRRRPDAANASASRSDGAIRIRSLSFLRERDWRLARSIPSGPVRSYHIIPVAAACARARKKEEEEEEKNYSSRYRAMQKGK